MADQEYVRAWLLDQEVKYLNHGAFGACPAAILEARARWQREFEGNPLRFVFERFESQHEAARGALAGFLGASRERLVFTTNATEAVNMVLKSLPLKAGDRLLATNHNYPGCLAALDRVAERSGAEVVKLDIPFPPESSEQITEIVLRAADRGGARLALIDHVSSESALVFPVAEIVAGLAERGVDTLVDGAHAPGMLPLDLDALGAAWYAGNCHKWLCAPKGAAFLHARPELQGRLEAVVVSWGYSERVEGHTSFDGYLGSTPFLRRHQWQGTRDLAAFLSVPAAIAFQREHRWPEVRRRCHELALRTRDRIGALTSLPPICDEHGFAQMVAAALPEGQDPEALKAALLERYRIEVPITLHRGRAYVRVSFQGYNTEADADALLAALAELLSARRGTR